MNLQRKHLMAAVMASLAAWLVAFPAGAHHSIAAQFDMTKKITVQGTIVRMEWRNPHAWLQIEVENEQGQAEVWQIEFLSANTLYRQGWRRDDLPVGAMVTVSGLPSRDGSRVVDGEDVILSDGRTLFAGTGPQN